MNKLELIQNKLDLNKRAMELIQKGESEVRKLTETEDSLLVEIRKQIADIDEKIKNIDKELEDEKRVLDTQKKNNTEKRDNMKSLVNEIRSIVNGEKTDKKFEVRAFSVGAGAEDHETEKGGETVPTEIAPLLTPLRDHQVLGNFTWLTGLTGNVSIPSMGAVSCGWKGELKKGEETDANITSVGLSPKRLTAYCILSKQLLFQSNSNIEAIVREEIQKAVSDRLQQTVLGDSEGTSDRPEGLFYNSPSISVVDFEKIVAIEQSVEEANAVATGYIINPSIKGLCRTKVKSQAQGGFLFEGGELDGMPTSVTNASKGILYGNLKDIVVAQFNTLSLTVDDVTLADQDAVKIVINAYFDCVNRRKGQGTVVAKKVGTTPSTGEGA